MCMNVWLMSLRTSHPSFSWMMCCSAYTSYFGGLSRWIIVRMGQFYGESTLHSWQCFQTWWDSTSIITHHTRCRTFCSGYRTNSGLIFCSTLTYEMWWRSCKFTQTQWNVVLYPCAWLSGCLLRGYHQNIAGSWAEGITECMLDLFITAL